MLMPVLEACYRPFSFPLIVMYSTDIVCVDIFLVAEPRWTCVGSGRHSDRNKDIMPQ